MKSFKNIAILFLASTAIFAADPDVLTMTNGEKLIGHLVRTKDGSVTFHSDSLGDVNVAWAKVKELQTASRYAVVPKGVRLHRAPDGDAVARGTISEAEQKIKVTPAGGEAPRTIDVKDAAYIIDEPTFMKASERNPYFFGNWNGPVTAGASLVEATQNSSTFTGTVHLARMIPTESWLDPANRTLLNFSASYGKLDQPNTPTIKTEIFHLDLERDQYFSSRLYGFGQAAFDHSFSQGLDLQQSYGGGIGWTALKNDVRTLDLKASVNYLSQHFQQSSQDQNLIASTFAENYRQRLGHGIIFDQQITITPAWNNTNAYSAAGNAGITMPVYKRVSLSISAVDAFINNPPLGFKKNSFQFTTGLSYSLK